VREKKGTFSKEREEKEAHVEGWRKWLLGKKRLKNNNGMHKEMAKERKDFRKGRKKGCCLGPWEGRKNREAIRIDTVEK